MLINIKKTRLIYTSPSRFFYRMSIRCYILTVRPKLTGNVNTSSNVPPPGMLAKNIVSSSSANVIYPIDDNEMLTLEATSYPTFTPKLRAK